MKILSAADMRRLDAFTIANEPIDSINLMERASVAFTNKFLDFTQSATKDVSIICGSGNNGGDGLAIARLLLNKGWKVSTYLVKLTDKLSDDCKTNLERLSALTSIVEVTELSQILLSKRSIVIDAVLGIGVNRIVDGFAREVIKYINNSSCNVFSVDMPSGLYTDEILPADAVAVKASYTFTFHAPKLALLLPTHAKYTGNIEVLDIGLSTKEDQLIETQYNFTTKEDVTFLGVEQNNFAHKGTYGHALIIAGSYGMSGAAVLSARAATKSGCGLVSVSIPASSYNIMQSTVPETMIASAANEHTISIPDNISKYNAIGVGPGIGTSQKATEVFQNLLIQKPESLVIDADALNIIAQNKELLHLLPTNSILTPHPKEFQRLAGEWKDDLEKLNLLISFSIKYNIIVVLKGAFTAIATPAGHIHFNSTGNNGMAKGGSGDVLTGIITSLLAQKFSPIQAAVAGVYIHGLAGDIARNQKGRYGMTPSDIIDFLPVAFKTISE